MIDFHADIFRKGLILTGITLAVWGCAGTLMPPPTAPLRPRETVNIESFKFRAAVIDFRDQTGQAGDLVKTVPDILTTALFKSGRIDLYDRGALRGLSARDAGEEIKALMDQRRIDGVVSGTVTRFSRSERSITVELRLLSRNKAVMYADQHTLSYTGRRAMEISREDVFSLGKAISGAVPKVPDLQIVSKNGDLVTLNGGSKKGLVVGMTGYIQTFLHRINDPVTGEIAKPSPIIVGEVVINQVSDDTAIGRIVAGEDILVNDMIRFK